MTANDPLLMSQPVVRVCQFLVAAIALAGGALLPSVIGIAHSMSR